MNLRIRFRKYSKKVEFSTCSLRLLCKCFFSLIVWQWVTNCCVHCSNESGAVRLHGQLVQLRLRHVFLKTTHLGIVSLEKLKADTSIKHVKWKKPSYSNGVISISDSAALWVRTKTSGQFNWDYNLSFFYIYSFKWLLFYKNISSELGLRNTICFTFLEILT